MGKPTEWRTGREGLGARKKNFNGRARKRPGRTARGRGKKKKIEQSPGEKGQKESFGDLAAEKQTAVSPSRLFGVAKKFSRQSDYHIP